MRRKNTLRMSKSVNCMTLGDQHFLEEHEEALQGHAEHHKRDQQEQALEALVRQISINIWLNDFASIQDSACDRLIPGRGRAVVLAAGGYRL